MMHEIIDAFDKADNDDAVRAIIVTGDGERAFALVPICRKAIRLSIMPSAAMAVRKIRSFQMKAM